MKESPEIKTERLLLRPFELSDADDIQRLAGDKAIADTTLNIPHPYEDGMAEEWIATHRPKFEAGELVNFAIVSKASNELMGAIGLIIVPQFERAELGYWIGKPFWLMLTSEVDSGLASRNFWRHSIWWSSAR